MFACEYGHENAVKLLLGFSELISMITVVNKKTAFMLACERGQLKVIRLLLDYSENKSIVLNKQDKIGLTAFMFVCENGHKGVVNML